MKSCSASAKNSWMELAANIKPNYFVTIAFNLPIKRCFSNTISAERFYRAQLKKIIGRLDKKLVGKNYLKECRKQFRCEGLAIPEHIASNGHYHILLRYTRCDLESFKKALSIVLNGLHMDFVTYDVQLIDDLKPLERYCFKEYNSSLHNDISTRFIILSEFHSTL